MLGLINTGLNRSARAVSKAAKASIGSRARVFRAKGDQSKRNQIYSTRSMRSAATTKRSRTCASMVSVERLLLFLMSGRAPENVPKSMGEATKAALRDCNDGTGRELQGAKSAIPAGSYARPHQPRSERHHQLFSVIAVVFMPPFIRQLLDLRHELQGDAGARLARGYPLAITLMAFAAIGP